MHPMAISHSIWGSSSKPFPSSTLQNPRRKEAFTHHLVEWQSLSDLLKQMLMIKVDTWRFQGSFQSVAITDGPQSVVGVEFCIVCNLVYTLLSPAPHHHTLYILPVMAGFLIEPTQFVTVTSKYMRWYFHICNGWSIHVAQFFLFLM